MLNTTKSLDWKYNKQNTFLILSLFNIAWMDISYWTKKNEDTLAFVVVLDLTEFNIFKEGQSR